MPSRIEELIAWGRKEVPRLCKLGNQLATARAEGVEDFSDMLERAYREEVVPMVQTLRDALAWVPPCSGTDAAIKDILRRFDAPAGTEPKQ